MRHQQIEQNHQGKTKCLNPNIIMTVQSLQYLLSKHSEQNIRFDPFKASLPTVMDANFLPSMCGKHECLQGLLVSNETSVYRVSFGIKRDCLCALCKMHKQFLCKASDINLNSIKSTNGKQPNGVVLNNLCTNVYNFSMESTEGDNNPTLEVIETPSKLI